MIHPNYTRRPTAARLRADDFSRFAMAAPTHQTQNTRVPDNGHTLPR
jgi:hypothetical protein